MFQECRAVCFVSPAWCALGPCTRGLCLTRAARVVGAVHEAAPLGATALPPQPAPTLPSRAVVMASCSCLGMKCPAGVPASLAAVQQDSACSPDGFLRLEGFSVSHSPSQHSPGSVKAGLTSPCTQEQLSVTAGATAPQVRVQVWQIALMQAPPQQQQGC